MKRSLAQNSRIELPKKVVKKLTHSVKRVAVYVKPSVSLTYLKQGLSYRVQESLKKIDLSSTKNPDVSIIIPVFNKIDLTIHCLAALSELNTKYGYEVVIIDNSSSDQTQPILSQIKNLVYVRNEENAGFVGGCNQGADKARGKYLVFLNNDTRVDRNWLDPLIDDLEQNTDFGLVGSKLVYPDGRLQEAGGIIWRDGSGHNYGRGDDPNKAEYNYRREVDYCSGASIAIAKALFTKLGQFDALYAPAYYEDTDLAFKVRAAGLKVVYQPLSVVVHYEGATAGTDLSSGFKKYQLINQKKFVKKWAKQLKEQKKSGEVYQARDRAQDKLILIIDSIVPEPDRDSGSNRMYQLMEMLQELGYKITFWPDNLYATLPYTRTMQQQGIEVIYGKVKFEDFVSTNGKYYDAAMISRAANAEKYLASCRHHMPQAKLLFDTVDLHFLRAQRQMEVEQNKQTAKEAERWRELELNLINQSDITLVVSDYEQNLLKNLAPKAHVEVVSNIHNPKPLNQPAFKDRHNLLFIGNFEHTPNVDAIEWVIDEIWPKVKKSIPTAQLQIIGPKAPDSLLKKATKEIEFLGYVPAVESYFANSRVFIAPLRYGAGVKGKIGQSIEFGLPVVTTTIGAEGMHLTNNENCLIADNAEDFAAAIIKLYHDQKLWQKLQNNATKVLEQHFSSNVAKQTLKRLLP